MSDRRPTILWLRRDLRLSDHPALMTAIKRGGPVVPVFIHDELVEGLGPAPKWRLGLSLEDLCARLASLDSRLILRRGDALSVLRDMVRELDAGAVMWSRLYDPDSVTRDKQVKAALKEDGVEVASHAGHLLFEPWSVETGTGGFYKVYTPFWRAVRGREIAPPLAAPS